MLPVFVINLDRSPDRLARMRAEFARVGMTFERFPAVHGLDLPDELKPYFCDAEGKVASSLRPGEVGAYASHIGVWRRIAGTGDSPVLVCEDDLRLPDGMPAILKEILARAPAGWDILRLSSDTGRRVVAIASVSDNRMLVRFVRSPINVGAYLLTPRGASKLIRVSHTRKLSADRDLTRPWLFNLNEIGVLPPPVEQNVEPSISAAMGGRARDRSLLRRSRDRWHRLVFNLRTLGLLALLRAARPPSHTLP